MNTQEIHSKLKNDLFQVPWFAHKEQLKLSSNIKLQKITDLFFSLILDESPKIEYRFPWAPEKGFLWDDKEWLQNISLQSQHLNNNLEQSKHLLTQSTHPGLLIGNLFVKFLPRLHSSGAQREIVFAQRFKSKNGALVSHAQVHYHGECLALLYPAILEGINAWDFLIQASRAQILDLTLKLLLQILELFAPSRQAMIRTLASDSLQQLLGAEIHLNLEPSLAHMDCHLGQWLFSPKEQTWKLIDFGACPMENPWWNGPDCLEMDLAGLMRSVDYRLITLGLNPLSVDEYLSLISRLPSCQASLIAAAVVARNAYECAYELKHRPHWHSIPKQGLSNSIQLWQTLQHT